VPRKMWAQLLFWCVGFPSREPAAERPCESRHIATKTTPYTSTLVDGSEDPWSVDLVVEAFSFMLLDGFAFALVAVCMR